MFEPVELWSGVHSSNGDTLGLSEPITNFQLVIVIGQFSSYGNQAMTPLTLPTAIVPFGTDNVAQRITYGETTGMLFRFATASSIYTIDGFTSTTRLRKVYGLFRKET